MQIQINLKRTPHCLIVVSILGLLSGGAMVLEYPQSIMDIVGIRMSNDHAIAFLRELYGGIGLMFIASMLCLMLRDVILGLAFSSLLWCFYGLSKIATIFSDGMLGALSRQWLLIEFSLCLFAAILFCVNRKAEFIIKSKEHEIN